VWWPIAPQGFKSLGCVVNLGTAQPTPGTVSCIRYEFVTSAPLAERLIVYPPTVDEERSAVRPEVSLASTDATMCCWCVDTLVSSFLMTSTADFPGSHLVCELRSPLFETFRAKPEEATTVAKKTAASLSQNRAGSMRNQSLSFKTVREFSRVWKDTSKFGSKISFWRPKGPEGYAIFGDCVMHDHAAPHAVQVSAGAQTVRDWVRVRVRVRVRSPGTIWNSFERNLNLTLTLTLTLTRRTPFR